MPFTIAIAGLKGGVGKTTIALNTGVLLHKLGYRVQLVDADPQGSLQEWANDAEQFNNSAHAPSVIGIDGPRLRTELERRAALFDFIVIDTPGRLGKESRTAMLAADLVVIPNTPGPEDIRALGITLNVLDEARGLRPELEACLVMNRMDSTKFTAHASKTIGDQDVPMLSSVLRQRVEYREASGAGMGVAAFKPNGEAAREFRRMVKEMLGDRIKVAKEGEGRELVGQA
jgi:chromosome partitioning protein